jgi:acetyl esterase/lipase
VRRRHVYGLPLLLLGQSACSRQPALERFSAARGDGNAVVICPGGGYTHLSIEKEGREVARYFNRLGLSARVLRYRLERHPAPLNDVRAAVRLLRRDCRAGAQVGVVGFSAGAHLAACASNLFETDAERPDFAVLVYPVITLRPPHAHAGSRRALLGPSPSPALVESLSLETRVTPRTPPTFLVHAKDDRSVPLENSLLYQSALDRAGVPSELSLHEHGGHGFGLRPTTQAAREWPTACAAWLRARGLID